MPTTLRPAAWSLNRAVAPRAQRVTAIAAHRPRPRRQPQPRDDSIGFSLEGRDADVQLYDVLLDGKGATFSLGGRALTTQSGTRSDQPASWPRSLAQRGPGNRIRRRHRAPGLTTVREIVATLTPLRRRMDRYEVNGRSVLDDTAGRIRTASFGDLRRRGAPSPPRARRRLRNPRPPRPRHQPAHCDRIDADSGVVATRPRAAHR